MEQTWYEMSGTERAENFLDLPNDIKKNALDGDRQYMEQ